MDDESDFPSVDAHAERIGCDNHATVGFHKAFLNRLARLRRRRGGEGKHAVRFHLTRKVFEAKIIRTEIMSPKRDAMGFVDGKQADVCVHERPTELIVLKTLRSDVEDLEMAGESTLQAN